mmetsp:Transcript_36072/g.80274  ORF Transcript_36072/g.80274 Transcript_36072/m.80274 type:complete len:450 (+) Transcript_36072:228-1577(+)|eukprot:CAMPEP_0202903620 /NCGR_PEP_ID=MMETSP1392-20130828/25424_1 /ASSEMBLY_ACC=CAM_ASM_000868 /TAXON_ID=225041 /ORGANISM="Chlamydomonas chlamydogama, Strain SAG 11-48b" /LENGTH=449 /DNA_ID=CAMNT_0049590885 /DNA_START=217 /DNA_END=1566 /DNA_ORIENTATION=+
MDSKLVASNHMLLHSVGDDCFGHEGSRTLLFDEDDSAPGDKDADECFDFFPDMEDTQDNIRRSFRPFQPHHYSSDPLGSMQGGACLNPLFSPPGLPHMADVMTQPDSNEQRVPAANTADCQCAALEEIMKLLKHTRATVVAANNLLLSQPCSSPSDPAATAATSLLSGLLQDLDTACCMSQMPAPASPSPHSRLVVSPTSRLVVSDPGSPRGMALCHALEDELASFWPSFSMCSPSSTPSQGMRHAGSEDEEDNIHTLLFQEGAGQHQGRRIVSPPSPPPEAGSVAQQPASNTHAPTPTPGSLQPLYAPPQLSCRVTCFSPAMRTTSVPATPVDQHSHHTSRVLSAPSTATAATRKVINFAAETGLSTEPMTPRSAAREEQYMLEHGSPSRHATLSLCEVGLGGSLRKALLHVRHKRATQESQCSTPFAEGLQGSSTPLGGDVQQGLVF